MDQEPDPSSSELLRRCLGGRRDSDWRLFRDRHEAMLRRIVGRMLMRRLPDPAASELDDLLRTSISGCCATAAAMSAAATASCGPSSAAPPPRWWSTPGERSAGKAPGSWFRPASCSRPMRCSPSAARTGGRGSPPGRGRCAPCRPAGSTADRRRSCWPASRRWPAISRCLSGAAGWSGGRSHTDPSKSRSGKALTALRGDR